MKKSVTGSIYKADDGKRWIARLQYSTSGKRRQKKRICLTHAQAVKMLADLQNEIERSNDTKRSYTYADLDRLFRAEYLHKAKIVNGVKISGYRQKMNDIVFYLNAAIEYFADKELTAISYSDIQNYKKTIQEKRTINGRERSASSINHHLRWIRRLLNIAVQKDWIAKNPFKNGKGLIVDSIETNRTRVLTADEENRLLIACDDPQRLHLKPILIVAVETGLRSGEFKKLRWADINLEKRFLTVQSLNAKTLRSRLVPISDRALNALKEIKKHSFKLEVIGNIDFKRSFNTACKIAGLTDVNFHDLRHTAITRWLEKGISPPLAMKASGHTQTKTFLRYVNQTENSVSDFARILSQNESVKKVS